MLGKLAGSNAQYSIVQWNEDNLYSESPYVKAAYQKKRYAFVADYMRLWALYNSGIYMDTDVEMVKPFDELLGEKIFLGRQSPTSVGVGVIGATKGHPFLKRIMDSLDAEAMSGRITFMPLPELVDSLLASSGNEDITILPEDCCYPYNPYSPEVIRRKPCCPTCRTRPSAFTIGKEAGWAKSPQDHASPADQAHDRQGKGKGQDAVLPPVHLRRSGRVRVHSALADDVYRPDGDHQRQAVPGERVDQMIIVELDDGEATDRPTRSI